MDLLDGKQKNSERYPQKDKSSKKESVKNNESVNNIGQQEKSKKKTEV